MAHNAFALEREASMPVVDVFSNEDLLGKIFDAVGLLAAHNGKCTAVCRSWKSTFAGRRDN